jgi:hypothetical protein
MPSRANQLADRIEEGAALLAAVAQQLTPEQWATPVLPDGRTVGVIVHHVANMYPIELDVVRSALAQDVISDVTWDIVADINAAHAREHAGVSKEAALALLAQNSASAAREVRNLTDAELDRAVPFSLSYDAPVTVQYIIEDHPMRHPWHHLARIQRTLGVRVIRRTSVTLA